MSRRNKVVFSLLACLSIFSLVGLWGWYQFLRIPDQIPTQVLDLLVSQAITNNTDAPDGAIFVYHQNGKYYVFIVILDSKGRHDLCYLIDNEHVTELEQFPKIHGGDLLHGHLPAHLCYSKQFKRR